MNWKSIDSSESEVSSSYLFSTFLAGFRLAGCCLTGFLTGLAGFLTLTVFLTGLAG